MNATAPNATINEAKAEYLKRIRAELAGTPHPPGTLVAVNVLNGTYVLGTDHLPLLDKFRAQFGDEAIGWVAEVQE
jgi:hypothetical protein